MAKKATKTAPVRGRQQDRRPDRGSGWDRAEPVQQRERSTWVADGIESGARWVWRNKFPLAPVVLVAFTYWGAVAGGPVFTSVLMFLASGAAYLIKRYELHLRDRLFLSARERLILSRGLLLASAWSLFMAIPTKSPWWLDVLLLLAALAHPWFQWASSRKIRKNQKVKLSAAAIKRLNQWKEEITDGDKVPVTLQGSLPVKGSVSEPVAGSGSIAFTVQLDGHHGSDALNDACQRAIEARLGLPPGTAQLMSDRDHSTRLRVILTPERHLQKTEVRWERGVRKDDGSISLGETPDGKKVWLPLNNKDGVYHVRLFGNTGNGKSCTGRVLLAPEIAAGLGLVWLVDGKCGQSMPEMRKVIDWYSIDPNEWLSVINTAYAVMKARQTRYGAAGKGFFRVGEEKDPVLTLWLEETSEIKRKVGKAGEAKVMAIMQQGRACGVRVLQVSQSPKMDHILGGVDGRDLLKVGVLHKPGGRISKSIATEICSEPVDLMALPDEPGFAAAICAGQVLAPVMRVQHATDHEAADWAEDIESRVLEGDDLKAAGAPYARRGTDIPVDAVPVAEVEIEDDEVAPQAEAEEEFSNVQAWILKVLGLNADGLRIGELHEKGQGKPGRSRKNLQNNLRQLVSEGKVEQVDGNRYRKVKVEA